MRIADVNHTPTASLADPQLLPSTADARWQHTIGVKGTLNYMPPEELDDEVECGNDPLEEGTEDLNMVTTTVLNINDMGS